MASSASASAAAPSTAAALSVPRRHGSHSSLRQADNDLAPVTRSRANSDSSMHAPTLMHPKTAHRTQQTTLYASASHKPFVLDTANLMKLSPYLQKLLSETPEPTAEQTTFEGEDEFAMALFAKFVTGGVHALKGPTDFHTTQHYLQVYVLARKWGCEELENRVMDLIRRYYASDDMTATPFRLEYIYASVPEPECLMKRFFIETAAMRCTSEGLVSDYLRGVLAKPEMGADFMDALIRVSKEGYEDARKSAPCAWHRHEVTAKCTVVPGEAWRAAEM